MRTIRSSKGFRFLREVIQRSRLGGLEAPFLMYRLAFCGRLGHKQGMAYSDLSYWLHSFAASDCDIPRAGDREGCSATAH